MEAHRQARVVDIHTGEILGCEECESKNLAITRLTNSYEGSIRNLKDEVERLRDDRDAVLPNDEPAETVMRRWAEFAQASRWFTRPPQCGPTSTRWRDTKRALRGVKNKDGVWDWPPRSVADLLVVTRGAFIRAEEQRHDRGFKRDYLDPCTAFFSNYDRNWEAASDPAPGLQTRADFALTAPPVLSDRWLEVLDLAQPCDCGHIRLDHQKPALTVDDRLTYGECLVHGCTCTGFGYDWTSDPKVRAWVDAQSPREPS